LLRDNPVLDLVVRRLGNNLLLHELILGTIRPPGDDLCRISVADPWQCFQLLLVAALMSINALLFDVCTSVFCAVGVGGLDPRLLRRRQCERYDDD
jgi:hypothetical protein